ncbi:bone morphogenetic protein 10-like [Acipenser oxyrinchus oxyrinchus]|uniref:Bone morphogenetic protein 10 n=1 Tax=Acipenser oxyrinchus oxyrinchus TaxID=40147 RepID=A0AAD8CN31_ACIOX|nr:bone morphogenetic protein 10-like [Acipenser oxyrinchus oxyrinchus]KAK1154432.1 bone morphogenetic protein 10-like [Acipenser oxyrinchus oxyrinchus]
MDMVGLCAALWFFVHSGICSPIMAPVDLHPGVDPDGYPFLSDHLLEQDSGLDFQSFMQTIRHQFLKTFNLSGLPQHEAAAKVDPPEYMLELYNKFANDRTSMPSANIVRSFQNEDTSSYRMDISGIRKHSLLFNMSIPHHEKITMAELRLYTLVERDRRMYEGVDRKVTIYEAHEHIEADERRGGNDGHGRLAELASRQVYETDSGWEAFDLTAAIRRWRKADYTTHRLEVHIESLGEDSEGYGEGNLDIDVNPEAKHVPLLIVFSDDQGNEKKEEKKELNEMIEHEQLLEFEMGMMNGLEDSPNEESLLQMRSNLIYDTTSRIRRNAKGNTCKKTPFFVEFNEIGWHSWIIAPTGYEAFKCSGVCNYPLIEHVTPTKHAIVQTLVHMKNPQKASRACCVPTKLDPISILYLDDAGVVTFKYKYEGMVVAECGCR